MVVLFTVHLYLYLKIHRDNKQEVPGCVAINRPRTEALMCLPSGVRESLWVLLQTSSPTVLCGRSAPWSRPARTPPGARSSSRCWWTYPRSPSELPAGCRKSDAPREMKQAPPYEMFLFVSAPMFWHFNKARENFSEKLKIWKVSVRAPDEAEKGCNQQVWHDKSK